MEKEIKIKIEKSEVKETSVFGGIQGEGGARTLKISFDSEWDGLTKKITFFDAAMQNPVIIALTEDKNENGEYSVKIPSEPLKTGGKFTFIIDGTADGIRQRSVQRELRVKYAYPSKGTEEVETITPTVAEQLTASVNSSIEKTTELSAGVEDNKTEIGALKERAAAAEAAIALKADKTELPKKVSELENDSGYLTEHQSLDDYAKKTEVALKADKTELSEIKTELESKKVDKTAGKGLSSNDYTDEEKSKLAALPEKDVLDNALDSYALKADTVGKKTEDGGEIFNNYDGLFINQASGDHSHAEGAGVSAGGTFSHAEGKGSNASGKSAHAEGSLTAAFGDYSHSEGDNTTAEGEASHAEGRYSRAKGPCAHAEGFETESVADFSHSEGYYTKANGIYSHVQGKYNIADNADKYAHIVGNGTDENSRSNAHTLDWDGNGWFAGDVKVGSSAERLAKVSELPKKLTDLDVEWKEITLAYDADKTVLNTLSDGFYRVSEATNCGSDPIPSMSDIKHELYYLVVLTQQEDFRGFDEIDSVVEGTASDGTTIINGVSVHTQHIQYMIKNNSVNMRIFNYKYNLVNGWKKINTTEAELTSYVEGKLKSYPKNTEVLTKTNTAAYVPTEDYHPSTKKYADDAVTKLKKQSIPQGKAEGSSAKITDGLAGESPLKLNVYGNTDETSGVGDLNSASGKYEISVSATGKNLLRYPYANKNTTTNGITFKTQQDGTVLINGTASADAVFYIVYTNKPIILKKGKQYTLSGGGAYKNGIILCLQDNSFKQSTWGGTITAEYEKYYAFIKVNSGTTATNFVLKPQLEEGATATEYETYISGGTLTAALDRQLNSGEYIDFIGKKLVSADGETDITVSGELEIPETEACYISAGTQMSPEKTEVGYFQDINKVIKEMKNSILSLGGNV